MSDAVICGACHCGNIRFTLQWPENAAIPARACDCSFCTKHGGVWTSHPGASLCVQVREPGRVSVYAFATRTADFLVCAHCGVVPLVTCRLDDRLYAVVSVHALEGVDPALLQHAAASFAGENTEERLARRQRNWIGAVQFDPPLM